MGQFEKTPNAATSSDISPSAQTGGYDHLTGKEWETVMLSMIVEAMEESSGLAVIADENVRGGSAGLIEKMGAERAADSPERRPVEYDTFVSFAVPEDLKDVINVLAGRKSVSRSAWLRRCVIERAQIEMGDYVFDRRR